jgi:serine/threonine protein kinase
MTTIEPEPLPPGFRLSYYVIESELSPGRMGRIYKATDTNLGEVVAINVLSANLRDPEGLARFRARFARAFRRHRGRVHGYAEWEGIPFAVLAYPGEAGSVVDICDE